jgi:dienelactone hydrolase
MQDLPSFDDDRQGPLDIREAGKHAHDGIVELLFSYTSPYGQRRVAELIGPVGAGPHAAILYVHWYEPESHDSNRTQFHEEAADLAQRGAVSLLVETMWSDRDWFLKRTQTDDYVNSVRQVVELRQAIDLLLAQPEVDSARFAYVGHDFGAMYGVLTGQIDPRPTCYALMAGTPRFSDWYLYYPRLEGAARAAFVEAMGAIDPIAHVAALAPAPLLFQFGRADPHVPIERAQAFFDAAAEPKQIRWYDAGHALCAQATNERIGWLAAQLGLKG